MNPLISLVIASPLGRRLNSLTLITFDGRRSRRRLRTPVAFHMLDGVPHVFTDRPWRLNFAGGASVIVTRRGTTTEGYATLLDISADAVGSLIRQALDNESPRALGMKIRSGYNPTAADLGGLGQSAIRFDIS